MVAVSAVVELIGMDCADMCVQRCAAAVWCVCPAVYDYEYTSSERGTFKKLVFLLW